MTELVGRQEFGGQELRRQELRRQQLGGRHYFELPSTRKAIALCRGDVVRARIELATDRTLTDRQRAGLWRLIDSRELFVKILAKDYAAELERIDRELETEFSIP